VNTQKRADHYGRLVAFGLLGGIAVYAVFRLVGYATHWEDVVRVTQTMDHRLYVEAGRRWLEGGPMYPAWELAGPFTLDQMPELYPPAAVPLFALFSLLPDVLWWAVPLTIIAVVIWRHRPSLLGWVGIASLTIVWPHTLTAIQLGNPILFVAAFAALGTIWRPAFALVLLKPTLLPFALLGARAKAWWAVLAVLGLVSLPFAVDYLTVLSHVRGMDPLYSLHDAGIVMIPVVAWASRLRWQVRRPQLDIPELAGGQGREQPQV
jgi:hypothetical protein